MAIDAGNALSSAASGAASGAALGPWGAAAGAAIGLGSAVLGSVSSANKNRAAGRLIQEQRNENRKWYEMQMAQDYTQRSDSQAILQKQRDLLNEQYKNAHALNVVAGGTDQALALQKQAANDTVAETMSNMASEASAYKDQVQQQYRQEDAQLNQQQAAELQQQANNVAAAAGQGVAAGTNLIVNSLNSPVTTTTIPDRVNVTNPGKLALQADIAAQNPKPNNIPKAKPLTKAGV